LSTFARLLMQASNKSQVKEKGKVPRKDWGQMEA